jgi:hypothetical protein
MATVSTHATKSNRPATVSAAVLITVILNVVSLPIFILLPGSEDIPDAAIVVGLVVSVISLISAWAMWNLRRWGAIATFVLTLLNMLSALPAFGDPPSNWVIGAIAVSIPPTIVALVLTAHPTSRRAYR